MKTQISIMPEIIHPNWSDRSQTSLISPETRYKTDCPMLGLLHRFRDALTTRRESEASTARRVRLTGEPASDRFVLIIGLMVLFFVGLIGLEVAHMIWIDGWNDVIFNGIMLVVGTIVGAIWGRDA